jgi:uridine kinase
MHVIIIAGASGSGKTTIVELINDCLRANYTTLVISMDQYYRSMKPGKPLDWDNITAIDLDLLISDLDRLVNGTDSIKIPSYDYVSHQRIPDAHESGRPDVLILDGIFALYDPKVRAFATLSIYVDADPIKLCFKRRFHRDVTERGRSGNSVIKQYFEQVLPGYEKFVAPTKKYADLCYTNENDLPTVNTKFIRIVEVCIENNV